MKKYCDGKYFEKLWKLSMYDKNYGTTYVLYIFFSSFVYTLMIVLKKLVINCFLYKLNNFQIIKNFFVVCSLIWNHLIQMVPMADLKFYYSFVFETHFP